MAKNKSKRTSQDDCYLLNKLSNSHSYSSNDVLFKIKAFHQDLLFKEKMSSSVASSIQMDLNRLYGMEKDILTMKRQSEGILENNKKILKLKDNLKTLEAFHMFLIIFLVVLILVLALIYMFKFYK